MSWIATAVISSTSILSGVMQKKAAKKAKKQADKDALEAENQARKAEVFADTEGEGVGSLGVVSLEVDDEELDDNASSTVRI